MRLVGWFFIGLAILLWCWPTLLQRLWPGFRSRIAWERIVWGYRPHVLSRLAALVCVWLGVFWNVLLKEKFANYTWFIALSCFVFIAIFPAAFVLLSNQSAAAQQQEAYFRNLSPLKKSLYFLLGGASLGFYLVSFFW